MLAILQFLYDKLAPGSHAPAVSPVPTDANGAFVTVRNDHKIERLSGRAAQPGRRHTFANPESFAAFVVKHWPNADEVEILADTTKITATNKAAWFRDILVGDMRKHPDWLAWTALLSGTYEQRPLYLKMVPIVRCLPDGDKGVPDQVRSLNVVASAENKSELSEQGVWTIVSGTKGQEVRSKLAGSFKITTPVYLDGPPYTMEIKFILHPGEMGSAMKFQLVAIDREIVEIEAYEERVDRLRGLLGDAYLVGMGTMSFEG